MTLLERRRQMMQRHIKPVTLYTLGEEGVFPSSWTGAIKIEVKKGQTFHLIYAGTSGVVMQGIGSIGIPLTWGNTSKETREVTGTVTANGAFWFGSANNGVSYQFFGWAKLYIT